MNSIEIEDRILKIIERAEYAGRERGIALATRSQRRAVSGFENAELSERVVRQMAAALAVEIAEGTTDG